jgi:signal peptide peptidase SppA
MASRIPAIIRAVCTTPWAIQPEKLEAILEVLAERAAGIELSAAEIEARVGDRKSVAVSGSPQIAVLPLYGVIAQRMNLMSEFSGGTSAEKFGQMFDDAVKNPDVTAIVIDVDSPGGTVSGTPELAQKIFDARGTKRITAVVNSLMASAAYWIGSAADEIVCTPSGQAGSIGVYTVHTDISKMNEQDGITQTLIRAGKFKAETAPYMPLSDDAKAALQAAVDDDYDQFVAAVARNRGTTPGAVIESGVTPFKSVRRAVRVGADRAGRQQLRLSSAPASPIRVKRLSFVNQEAHAVPRRHPERHERERRLGRRILHPADLLPRRDRSGLHRGSDPLRVTRIPIGATVERRQVQRRRRDGAHHRQPVGRHPDVLGGRSRPPRRRSRSSARCSST